ncbi:alpha/beta fold hydrolase, partial [Desertihabitans aurantiacus]|uniref:alpha/beta fold hydrolase n=1 Tax=Desertihabitans aurantiacus TaxID=2282477 RepID=UPI0038BDC6FD
RTPPREVGLTAARAVHRLARLRPVQRLGGRVHRAGVALLSSERARVRRRPELRERYADADALATAVAEYSAYHGQGWDLLGLRSAHPYPPVPTVVLSSSTTGGRDWLARQNRLARLLGGRQVVVDDGRHMLMVDRPELVATAIRSVRPAAG